MLEAMKTIQMSVQGSSGQVRRSRECFHTWRYCRGLVWGYLELIARCDDCGTWWAPTTEQRRFLRKTWSMKWGSRLTPHSLSKNQTGMTEPTTSQAGHAI